MRDYYLVSYDIADPKRLRRVHRVVRDFGEPLQYSVFLCALTRLELARLRERLKDEIHHREDQVLFVHLGAEAERTLSRRLSHLGRALAPRDLKDLVY